MRMFPALGAAFLLAISISFGHGAAALADAVEQGDHKAALRLIEAKADLEAAQPDGMTALHWAAYKDETDLAKELVAAGASVTAENNYGIQPLYLACLNGNAELVELFLSKGADPNLKLKGGETLLMVAARTGKPEAVKPLIEQGAEVNARERRGQTAIMWAAAEGHTEVVELLIKSGAEFKEPLPNGFTPFLFAVREGRHETVKAFLKAGMDVNAAMKAKNAGGRNVRNGTSALIVAIENGHFELAITLLEAKADANDQRSGFTPLHTLVWVRKPNRGDDPDGDPAPNGSGTMSSLQFARKLIEHGADVNARLKTGKRGTGDISRQGMTPFMLACMTADLPYLTLLLESGADPTLGNSDDSTPLMAAAGLGTLAPQEVAGTEEEALATVKLLLSKGAEINAVDKNGETAMHGASYKSFPKVVEFLAASGAKVDVWNTTNRWGWTPLKIAEGYRPGNFRPSYDTMAAIQKAMIAAGVTPVLTPITKKDDSTKPPSSAP